MAEAIQALEHAVAGGDLDIPALEALEFHPETAAQVRDRALPLLAQLGVEQPETAAQVPETVVESLLRDLSLSQVLEKTGLDATALQNPVVRPLLLTQVAAASQQDESNPEARKLIHDSLHLIVDPELETSSVAAIERLVARLPQTALQELPFQTLFNGTGEQKARLMAINLRLLGRRVMPPLETLLWEPLESEDGDGDIILAALETSYVGDLIKTASREIEVQNKVHTALYELCRRYGKSILDNTIESVLAIACQRLETLFLELDVQKSLVKADRPSLIAQLPATYVVNNHPEIISQLELNNKNLYAIANLSQDFRAFQLLNLSPTQITQLPVHSQLLLASAATATQEGAQLFNERYNMALTNAVNAPESQENIDLKATLRANLSRYGIRIRRQPNVSTV